MKNWIYEYQIFSGIAGAVLAVIIPFILSFIFSKKEKDKGASIQRELRTKIFSPGLLRKIIDRVFPNFHQKLTLIGSLPKPPEYNIFNEYLRDLSARIENDIKMKAYFPLQASEVPQINTFKHDSKDPFVRPIHQLIRQIVGNSTGGDGANAQIATINRRNKIVRNIHKTLMRKEEPLVLLGDPGTGKTMTLQQIALSLSKKEIRRIFPNIIIYVRLGEFCIEGKVETKDVINFIKRELPENIKKYFDDLELLERLIVIFDGMDEMSRDRYNEHTEALSIFASSRQGRIKSLFSCRITDFSPKFIHQRLVLLPFNHSQIKAYLYKYFDFLAEKYLVIDGIKWTIRKLAKFLSKNKLPIENRNPFVLWLLCLYLQEKKTWPKSRIELLNFYCQITFETKQESQLKEGMLFPKMDQVFKEWDRFAYSIFDRNMGTAIPVNLLITMGHKKDSVLEMIRVGKVCGIIDETKEDFEYKIRFEHHRLQEYFAARYIHNSKTLKINWFEKLDAPCWQETIINLALMGSHSESVDALIDSINQFLQQLHDMLQDSSGIEVDENNYEYSFEKKYDDIEITLADRIELGARLIKQIKNDTNAIWDTMKQTIKKGLTFLIENGNPISQVKMMQACKNISNIDLIESLKKPLNSKIGWVRSQALLLIASNTENNRTIGTDLPIEMMYDLAQGLFLNRFILYLKPLVTTYRLYYWWSFLTIFVLSIFHMCFTIAVSYLLYFGAKYCGFDFINFFDNQYSLWGYSLIIFSAVFLGIKRESSFLCAIAPATGSIIVIVIILLQFTWKKGLFILFPPILMGLAIIVVIAILIYGLLAAFTQFISLTLALTFTGLIKNTKHPARLFFACAWQNCKYEIYFFNEFNLKLTGLTVISMVFAVLIINYKPFIDNAELFLLQKIKLFIDYARILFIQKIETFYFIFNKSNMTAIISTIILSLIILALIRLKSMNLAKRTESIAFPNIEWKDISLFLYDVLKYFGFIVLIVIFCRLMFEFFFIIENPHSSIIAGKVFSLILGFTIALILITVFFVFFKNFVTTSNWHKKLYPPNSLSTKNWIVTFKQSNYREQHNLLLRSTHESLNLSASEFLNILEQIKDDVLEDPSASTYWELRYQLEQILKQERY